MSQKPEVADADESRRQHVQQESAQELVDSQRHQTLLILVSNAPAESDNAIGERLKRWSRSPHRWVYWRDSKCMSRASKRTFRVNHPLGAEHRTQPGCERLRIRKSGECSVETEFMFRMQFPQAIHELAPEHLTENIDRQEESLLRLNPPRMVWR